MLKLYETIEKNEHNYLRTLLSVNGEEKTLPQNKKNILIRLSAELGHSQCCQILLSACASVDCRNDYEETPLHLAAWNGHSQCCKLLLDKGASPNPKNSNGWTPLQTTVWRCNVDCIKTLVLNDSVDYSCLDGFGEIVKHATVDEATKEVVLKLIESLGRELVEEKSVMLDDLKVDVIEELQDEGALNVIGELQDEAPFNVIGELQDEAALHNIEELLQQANFLAMAERFSSGSSDDLSLS